MYLEFFKAAENIQRNYNRGVAFCLMDSDGLRMLSNFMAFVCCAGYGHSSNW